ncbi:isochorismate synthase [Flavobacteriaceae bacterium D16]|nr:isochorismate synthase [Flavobacteriaceae bacterium D16]
MELLKRLKKQYNKHLPFVVYRKPDTSLCQAILQTDQSLETVHDFKETGFVMAPFSTGLPIILIRPDIVLEEDQQTSGQQLPFEIAEDDPEQEGKAAYISKVNEALEAIRQKKLQKVVLSRKITYKLQPDPFYTFQVLLNQFPEAFCYLFYHPETGIWMGASPETLLKYSTQEIQTVSLAGTQKANTNLDAVWRPKELREQEYVTQYIEKAVEGLADPTEKTQPKTVKAGNLLHLKTVIRASNPRVGLSRFIQVLHPTPAVCGIPANEAKAYLLANEGYPRSYYSGYLGELNKKGTDESELYVNLRCMNIHKDHVHVYVGGGLVEGSEPEQEWQETVHKSQSMLHLLRNSMEGLG